MLNTSNVRLFMCKGSFTLSAASFNVCVCVLGNYRSNGNKNKNQMQKIGIRCITTHTQG